MKYLSTYFTSFTIIILTVAIFNWFIDPFGMYWSPQIDGINKIKPESGSRTRITKAYRVHQIKPQILIVGNSRVEMGLSPSNDNFKGKSVYNQGIPGAGLSMQINYALDVINSNPNLESVIVSVDFFDFLMGPEELLSYKNNRTTPTPSYAHRFISDTDQDSISLKQLKEKTSLILSLDALKASINTLFQQYSDVNSISANGFNSARSYIKTLKHEGIKTLFQRKLSEVDNRLNKKQWQIIASHQFPYSPNFERLGRIIKAANKKNVKIIFFINPYHASYLHTIAQNKQWENFQLWKYTLVQYLSQQDHKIKLWDFSGFSEFVNEKVTLTKSSQIMDWYWEPAHYRKELGDLMLNTLMMRENKIRFGNELTVKNIDELLVADSQQLTQTQQEWVKLNDSIFK